MAVAMASAQALERQRTSRPGTERDGPVEVLVGQRADDGDQPLGVSAREEHDFVAADPSHLRGLDGIARVVSLRAARDRDSAANRVDPLGGTLVSPGNVMSD